MPQSALKNIMPDQSLPNLLHEPLSHVEACMRAQMQTHVPLLSAVGAHILTAGGKRVRPMLCLVSAALSGEINTNVVSIAAALELIHTATLLHDDVIDDARTRRGLETANIRFGNTASILSGDFLFSKAFELMVSTGSLEALRLLSSTSATISQGEVDQLASLGQLITRDRYLSIIHDKTASLFSAACYTGALLGGADAQTQELLEAFGRELGLAFQIIDDVIDYDGAEHQTGKNIGNDFFEGKVTLPVIIAIENNINVDFFKDCFLNEGQRAMDDFWKACDILKSSGAIDQTRAFAAAIVARAFENLEEAIPVNKRSELFYALCDVVHQVGSRTF